MATRASFVRQIIRQSHGEHRGRRIAFSRCPAMPRFPIFTGVGRQEADAHPGGDPGAQARRRNLRASEAAIDRPGPAAKWEERGTEEASRSASVQNLRKSFRSPRTAQSASRFQNLRTESIPVMENLKSRLLCRAAAAARTRIRRGGGSRHLRINFELNSAHAIANFQATAKTFSIADRAVEHGARGAESAFRSRQCESRGRFLP